MSGKKNIVGGLSMGASMPWFGAAVFQLRRHDGRFLP